MRETIIQFGEGNFLRGFVDDFIDILNRKGLYDGSIVVVKPRPERKDSAEQEPSAFRKLTTQHGVYNLILRGIENGQAVSRMREIHSISRTIDPYQDVEAFLRLARQKDLKFIISNTTEAGIVFDENCKFTDRPALSFPGKLTQLLYARFESGLPGFILLPCELIDNNADELKNCVLQYAKLWELGDDFKGWIEKENTFANTLVDRIVTGYPREDAEQLWQSLGYEDQLLDTAEPFGLWVIESPRDLSGELPLPACGLPVIFTDNQKPYKQRKVRILNGAHTSFVPAAFQLGYDIVLDAMNDPLVASFMHDTLHQEVIPTLTLPKDDLLSFADAVTQRFRNPFIKHALLSICLNSVSKWRARCMPSLLIYQQQTGKLPERLTFSLAALISLYRGGVLKDGKLECLREGEPYTLQDDAAVLSFFDENRNTPAAELAEAFIGREDFFGPDLKAVPGLVGAVSAYLAEIEADGIRAVMEKHFA